MQLLNLSCYGGLRKTDTVFKTYFDLKTFRQYPLYCLHLRLVTKNVNAVTKWLKSDAGIFSKTQ